MLHLKKIFRLFCLKFISKKVTEILSKTAKKVSTLPITVLKKYRVTVPRYKSTAHDNNIAKLLNCVFLGLGPGHHTNDLLQIGSYYSYQHCCCKQLESGLNCTSPYNALFHGITNLQRS